MVAGRPSAAIRPRPRNQKTPNSTSVIPALTACATTFTRHPPAAPIPNSHGGVRARRLIRLCPCAPQRDLRQLRDHQGQAWYVEDNWSVTANLILNLGVRRQLRQQGSPKAQLHQDGRHVAPRFGFAWDMKGDGTMKFFGNAGRYYLPVANVIDIKQAGGTARRAHLLRVRWLGDPRTQWQPVRDATAGPADRHRRRIAGRRHGGRPARRSDEDMDPVYQDEAILGFQQMINDNWSWGVVASTASSTTPSTTWRSAPLVPAARMATSVGHGQSW